MIASDIIYAALVASPGVTAVAGARIKPQLVPSKTELPAVAYLVQVDTPIDGSAALQRAMITCYCLAHDESVAQSLAVAVDAALNGYTGASGATRLSELVRNSWDELRDDEWNVWGRTLVYQAWIVY
mgnify:CR=1 FL=1